MKTLFSTFLLLLLIISIAFFSCNNNSVSTPTYTCDQKCQDGDVAYGISNIEQFIWNEHFAGHSTGNHDFVVNGPISGSIHITGVTGVSGDLNTLNLNFEMQNCRGQDDNYNLTFSNGTVNIQGSFGTNYEAIQYTSSSMTYTGSVSKQAPTNVNGSNCQISVDESLNSGTYTRTGTICGRTF